jgi:hypothetical protein
MPRKEKSVERFEKLVRPNIDAFTKLLLDFKSLFNDCDTSVLYGLPEPLIDSLARELPNFFADDEHGFERRLSTRLVSHYSIGLVNGQPVRSCLFEQRKAVTISEEDFQLMGWGKCGLTRDQVNDDCAEAERRGALMHDQTVAYAGWLMTNPNFLTEVIALREQTRELESEVFEEGRGYLFDAEMNAFCARWQLAKMASWDLPEPQGPNFAGIDLPESSRRDAEQVKLELPLTMRIPARMPIRDIVSEISNAAEQLHLREWQMILDRDSDDGSGLRQFRSIFQIQFFRNVVLASRYLDRFKGRVEPLDRAFGRFLELGEDSVKKLRLKIERRLRGQQSGRP